jgi:peptidoglycan/LPS O-acetylase OafA/YrhL
VARGTPDRIAGLDGLRGIAAAGILVLLAMLICMNATAVYLRYRFGKKVRW